MFQQIVEFWSNLFQPLHNGLLIGYFLGFSANAAPEIEILNGTYTEDQSFQVFGKQQPNSRSQTAILRVGSLSWHIKVTYRGEISNSADITRIGSWQKRRRDFQSLILMVQLHKLKLLDNTVTEVVILLESDTKGIAAATQSDNLCFSKLPGDFSSIPPENMFAHIANLFVYGVRDDPTKIRFPLYKDTSIPSVHQTDIIQQEELAIRVFRVRVSCQNIEHTFVYKAIERPLYHAGDTDAILNEISHLKLLKDVSNIVKLKAVLVSGNPYYSGRNKNHTVILGILLEYHPRGTLEDALKAKEIGPTWRKWPLQIAYGLSHLHRNGITHMDLKPSNILIDDDGNALLIDISGVGGETYEWLAPEVKNRHLYELTEDECKSNDVWSYGKILAELSKFGADFKECEFYYNISVKATHENSLLRPKIFDILEMF